MSDPAGPLPRVKEPHLAGRWYPAAAGGLAASVREMRASGAPRPRTDAILVPHAAYEYSGPTAARGFAAAGTGWRRALVLAPSHFAAFRGAAVLPMTAYRTPLGLLSIDQEALGALTRCPLIRANPAVFVREHAVACDVEGFGRYVESTGATICGRYLIEVLLRALPAGSRGEVLAHTTSLDASDEHDHVVGYAAVAFTAGP